MTLDATTPRSRRTLLIGAFGGLAAWAMAALGRPEQARAGIDGDVVLGTTNSAVNTTAVHNASSAANSAGVAGRSDASMTGLFGLSASSVGEAAPSLPGNSGVFGWADNDIESAGVWGDTVKGVGVRGSSEYIAVYGETDGGTGVKGQSQAGTGVEAYSYAGAGLLTATSKGFAIDSTGRLKFTRVSGVATILAGHTNVTVTPGVTISRSSFALLTAQSDIGSRRLWYTLGILTKTMTIRLSSVAPAGGVKVSWLLLG